MRVTVRQKLATYIKRSMCCFLLCPKRQRTPAVGWLVVGLAYLPAVFAQQQILAQDQGQQPLSTAGKWRNFVQETASPLTVGAGVFNGAVAHVTNTDPKYGTNGEAFAQRVGASTLNIATQNFFGDFVMASALHQDPRFFRKGPGYTMWSRLGYCISRSWLTRRDGGGTTFNWSNIFGAGASTGISYSYFPPASRSAGAMSIEFISDVLGPGLADIGLEFWPDVRQKLFHRH
jgi:hypothetical protein